MFVDEICCYVRVIKGVLYYYFWNKDEIFVGVVEKLEMDLIDEIVNDLGLDFWDQLKWGIDYFFDWCMDFIYCWIVFSDVFGVFGC